MLIRHSIIAVAALVVAACSDSTSPDARRASVEVVGLPDTLWSGTRDTVTAVARSRAGTVLAADTVHWTSSDTTTFVVDSVGVVRGREGGDAWLVVRTRGIVDSARVRVDHRPLVTPVLFVGHAITAISSPRTSCGVSTTGAAWCASTGPSGTYAEVPGGLVFREVQVGQRSTCGVATDDRMHCWGRNDYWTLGAGTSLATNAAVTTPVLAAGDRRFSRVAIGAHMTTCGIGKADSLAWCWGHNDLGQTGRAPTGGEPDPMPVPGVPKVVDLSIGLDAGCAVTVDGALWCWGGSGLATSIVAREIAPAGSYVEVQTASGGICARRPDGIVECRGSFMGPARQVNGGALRLASLYGGGSELCGLTATGEMHCWSTFAWNGDAPLIAVQRLRTKRFRSVSEGSPFCGLTEDGNLYC